VIEPTKPSHVEEQLVASKKDYLNAPTKKTLEVPAPSKKPTQEKSNGHNASSPLVTKPVEVVAAPTSTPEAAEQAKKIQKIVTRTLSTFVMIGGFICRSPSWIFVMDY
jgi:hypothetical protein